MSTRKQVWTPERLEVLLRAVCMHRGGLPRSRKALAEGLGVHPSTLRRWLRRKGGWRGAPAAIPPARLDTLLREMAPTTQDVEREELQGANALAALARLKARRVPLDAWREQDWLSPHRVWVEEGVNGLSLVRFTRVGTRRDHPEPGAQNVRSLVTANRFEAQLVKLAVLREISPWRVRIAGTAGGSERWITGARLRPLEVLYDELRPSLRDPVRGEER